LRKNSRRKKDTLISFKSQKQEREVNPINLNWPLAGKGESMDKEEKKGVLKGIKGLVKGVAFFVVVGAIVMHGLMSEDQHHAWMVGWHGFLAELLGSLFIGFIWVLGAYLTWGMFNLWVLGKDITKIIKEVG